MDDPIDFVWNLFWGVAWIVGTIAIGAFIYAQIREYLDKDKPKK